MLRCCPYMHAEENASKLTVLPTDSPEPLLEFVEGRGLQRLQMLLLLPATTDGDDGGTQQMVVGRCRCAFCCFCRLSSTFHSSFELQICTHSFRISSVAAVVGFCGRCTHSCTGGGTATVLRWSARGLQVPTTHAKNKSCHFFSFTLTAADTSAASC